MSFNLFSLVAFLLSFCSFTVLADYTFVNTKTTCRTTYASTSTANVPTTTKSSPRMVTYTQTSTSTPIKIITPSKITSTTDTYTLVTKVTTAKSAPSLLTTTFTSTTTSEEFPSQPDRTTVQVDTITDDRFDLTKFLTGGPTITPVLDTLPAPSKKKRSRIELGRRQDADAAVVAAAAVKYPKRVVCNLDPETVKIVIVTKTAATSTITAPVYTQVVTKTYSLTSTSTVYPANTYSTKTKTQTVTFTTTYRAIFTDIDLHYSESTVYTSVATIYPQCTGRNVAGSAGYKPDDSSVAVREFGVRSTTKEECCTDCIDDPTCGATWWSYREDGSTICHLIAKANGVCNAAKPLLLTDVVAQGPASGHYGDRVSNGKCGIYDKVEYFG